MITCPSGPLQNCSDRNTSAIIVALFSIMNDHLVLELVVWLQFLLSLHAHQDNDVMFFIVPLAIKGGYFK